jgi:CRP/FNR family cyclic AMP-dependent transcriptional regulator
MATTVETISQSPMFANVPVEKLQKFAELAEEIPCVEDSTLFKEGDPANKLYILLEGKVLIKLQITSRPEQICIGVLAHPGQLVGWSGFLAENRYTATAACQENSRLLSFDGAAFMRLLEADPVTGFTVMKHFSEVISGRLRNIQRLVLKTL